MEKETERGTYVLKEDEKLGAVQIADDVVAMIASLAAAEVEGVSALVGNITNELMSRVGMKKLTKGVKVEVVDGVVSVDIAIVIEYGHNIPQTSRNVQNKVKAAIENMTGLEVADINIRIFFQYHCGDVRASRRSAFIEHKRGADGGQHYREKQLQQRLVGKRSVKRDDLFKHHCADGKQQRCINRLDSEAAAKHDKSHDKQRRIDDEYESTR